MTKRGRRSLPAVWNVEKPQTLFKLNIIEAIHLVDELIYWKLRILKYKSYQKVEKMCLEVNGIFQFGMMLVVAEIGVAKDNLRVAAGDACLALTEDPDRVLK